MYSERLMHLMTSRMLTPPPLSPPPSPPPLSPHYSPPPHHHHTKTLFDTRVSPSPLSRTVQKYSYTSRDMQFKWKTRIRIHEKDTDSADPAPQHSTFGLKFKTFIKSAFYFIFDVTHPIFLHVLSFPTLLYTVYSNVHHHTVLLHIIREFPSAHTKIVPVHMLKKRWNMQKVCIG